MFVLVSILSPGAGHAYRTFRVIAHAYNDYLLSALA